MELSSHFDLAKSQGYLSEMTYRNVEEKMDSLLKLINGYIRYFRQSKRGLHEPGNRSVSDEPLDYIVENQDEVELES